jgi:hypothetical protein
MSLLCTLVAQFPIGTNLNLLHLLWMLVSGQLLESRGAVIPGLDRVGLSARAVHRAWAALGGGDWSVTRLLACWVQLVTQEGRWRPREHQGYHPLAVDTTGFWRPRLRGCPTTHYHATGKSLPAIPIGIIARTGNVGAQRLALPLGLVRADPVDPSASTHTRALVRQAVRLMAPQDVLVVDSGFGVSLLQQEGVTRYVARVAKNFTARRATPAEYRGVGRRPTRGEIVRPLPRSYKGRVLEATPADHTNTWSEGEVQLRAEVWQDLILPDAGQGAPTFSVVVIHDPRYKDPLVLATPLSLPARSVRELYQDRWPIEQIPLAAKQMLGASRAFVSAPETRQRLPELALFAGSVLSYTAATSPAIPTGFWDRSPEPTPGRLRRLLARTPFPRDFPIPVRIRQKASVTDHLPKGFWDQRHRSTPFPLPDVA